MVQEIFELWSNYKILTKEWGLTLTDQSGFK